MRRALAALLGSALWLGALAPAAAQAPPRDPPALSKETCAAAYVDGQTLRKDGKLAAARVQFYLCAQSACPAALTGDCARWAGEVGAAMPSLVFAVKGVDGNDTTAVRLSIDGQLTREVLDGRPIELDPGPHRIRLEHGSEKPIELDIVVQQGVKNRPVPASFAKVAPPPPPVLVPEKGPVDRGHPVAAYVLGGVSLAGFASFAGFGLTALGEANDLEEGCGITPEGCSEDQISAVEKKLLAADISLGVGIAAFAVGLGLFLHHHLSDPDPPVAARIELAPTHGGFRASATFPF